MWRRIPPIAVVLAGLTAPAAAARFENSYVSFVLPDRWRCQLQVTEFVCTPPLQAQQKTSVIMILSAKESGPDDNFADYWNYLSTDLSDDARSSLVEGPAYEEHGDSTWITAVHFDSEVPAYYTRYLATIRNGIAILVTFSAHQSVYASSRDLFLPALATLEVKGR